MTTSTDFSDKEIKEYKKHIQKKYSKKSYIQKNKIIDEIIDTVQKHNQGEAICDAEEIMFLKLEAQAVAEMIIRWQDGISGTK